LIRKCHTHLDSEKTVLIGYAGVSTQDQKISLQIEALAVRLNSPYPTYDALPFVRDLDPPYSVLPIGNDSSGSSNYALNIGKRVKFVLRTSSGFEIAQSSEIRALSPSLTDPSYTGLQDYVPAAQATYAGTGEGWVLGYFCYTSQSRLLRSVGLAEVLAALTIYAKRCQLVCKAWCHAHVLNRALTDQSGSKSERNAAEEER